jgi:hypothetical protein
MPIPLVREKDLGHRKACRGHDGIQSGQLLEARRLAQAFHRTLAMLSGRRGSISTASRSIAFMQSLPSLCQRKISKQPWAATSTSSPAV